LFSSAGKLAFREFSSLADCKLVSRVCVCTLFICRANVHMNFSLGRFFALCCDFIFCTLLSHEFMVLA
jgi:hypothetical protein